MTPGEIGAAKELLSLVISSLCFENEESVSPMLRRSIP